MTMFAFQQACLRDAVARKASWYVLIWLVLVLVLLAGCTLAPQPLAGSN